AWPAIGPATGVTSTPTTGPSTTKPSATPAAGCCPPTGSPNDLAGATNERRVWVISDDVEDPGAATTILWPSDYWRQPNPSPRPLPSRRGPFRVRTRATPRSPSPHTGVAERRRAISTHMFSPRGVRGWPLVGDAVDHQAARRPGGLPAVRGGPVARCVLH